ncbi:MAG TPA: hypothetical protein DD490_31595, partial [Acidobacteria bacterium]|nr:hypothetical protein [Acidobacteriota bacterium]
NLEEEEDRVTRTGRLRFRDRAGTLRPTWAAHAVRGLETPVEMLPNRFWIDGRIDGTRYARISWRDVPATLERRPELFRDRLVLVGGDFPEDRHAVPQRSGVLAVSGLTLQALLVDTIAAGMPVREPPRTPFVIAQALLLGLALTGLLCAPRLRPAVLGVGAAV